MKKSMEQIYLKRKLEYLSLDDIQLPKEMLDNLTWMQNDECHKALIHLIRLYQIKIDSPIGHFTKIEQVFGIHPFEEYRKCSAKGNYERGIINFLLLRQLFHKEYFDDIKDMICSVTSKSYQKAVKSLFDSIYLASEGAVHDLRFEFFKANKKFSPYSEEFLTNVIKYDRKVFEIYAKKLIQLRKVDTKVKSGSLIDAVLMEERVIHRDLQTVEEKLAVDNIEEMRKRNKAQASNIQL